ncbi:WxL protein peptidoglycan domain-containing protein [Weissella confusa]|uniref:WxL protein peptidoglycan domain-containing protein n=1 Tax=Weissella confusa TaxID=1583 RepID=UPI0022DF12EA|nr:DUF916 domain-containing protein [Weissella confusa]
MTVAMKKWGILSLSCLLGLLLGANVSATTLKGQDLTVTPVISESGTQGMPNIYSFHYEADHEYVVEADITNTGSEKRRYQAEIEDAYTNQNGQLVYRDTEKRQGIRELTNQPKQTGAIAPQETKHVTFHLKTDQQPFDGVKIGGLRVTELAQASKNDIKNNISLITSIVMATSEVETTAVSGLDVTSVADVFTTSKRGYEFKFSNDTAQLLTGVQATLTVYNHDEKVAEKTMQPIAIAPKSPFKLFLPLDGRPDAFTKAAVTFKKDDQEKTVSFNNAKPSPDVTNKPEKHNWTPYYWGGGLIVAGLAGGGYYLVKRRNHDGS